MKSKIRLFLQSFAVLFALTLLFSLIFAALYYFNVIHTQLFHILNWVFGVIAYGAGGYVLGRGIQKKALLNAFIVVAILLIPALILCDYRLMSLVEVASKSLSYLLVCVFIFNRTHTS